MIGDPTAPSLTRAEAERGDRERPHPCSRLGCDQPATKRLTQSIGGRPWFGCNRHWQAMSASLHVGMSGATSGGSFVEATDWRARK